MEETWKDIDGFEGYYQVSNQGRVRSFAKSWYTEPLILKQHINADGHANVYLSWAGKGKKVTTYKVHRLVAQAFIQNPLSLPYINHIDENKTNNNKDNLEWCTGQYNATYGNRLHCICGSNNKGSKLNEQIVEEIRKTYKKNDRKYGQRALARKYGVGHNAIGCIVRGKNWLHDPKEYLGKEVNKNDPR